MFSDHKMGAVKSKLAKIDLLPLVIIIAAFALRVVGNGFGLPDELHIDEGHLVPRAIRFGTGDLNPHFFLYPTLQMYLLFVLYAAYFVFGRLTGVFASSGDFGMRYFLDPTGFYVIGRTMTAAFGAATVALVYLLGRRTHSRGAGIAGAVFLALNPLHVEHSHYATTDVPMTFFMLLSLWFSLNILERGRARDYAAAGITAGLGAAIKYTGLLALAPIFLAHTAYTLKTETARNPAKYISAPLLLSFILAGAAFVAGCPYSVLDFTAFKTEILITLKLIQTETLGLENLGNRWAYIITHYVAGGITPPLFLLSLAGMAASFIKRSRNEMFVSAFLIFFYLVVGKNTQNFQRYWVPAMPLLILLAAPLAADAAGRAGKLANPVLTLIILAFAFVPCRESAALDMRLKLQKDTRTIAREWIEANIPSGAKVAVEIHGPMIKANRESLTDALAPKPKDHVDETNRTDIIGTSDRSMVKHSVTNKKLHFAALEKMLVTYYMFSSFSLAEYPLEFYRREGFEYIIKNSGVADRYIAAADKYPAAAKFYRELDESAQSVKTFAPEPGASYGQTIIIYRLAGKRPQ